MNFGGPTDRADSIRIVHVALDGGINFIDTADVYEGGESETIVGEALNSGRRQRVILATKVHYAVSDDINDKGNSRRHIMMAVEASLKRLATDWIDLYQIHRPMLQIPQEETLRALDDLVHQGKVRYIGSSTFPAWMVMEALSISERSRLARFVSEQPPYNLLDRRIENELVPLAHRYQLALLPWSPIAQGVLAGRYSRADGFPADSRAGRIGKWAAGRVSERGIAVSEQVAEVARRRHLTPSQVSLLWVKDQPGITAPIIGPRTLDQLNEALAVMEMRLDPETAASLDELVPPGTAVSDFHNTSGWMKMKVPF